MKNISIVIPVHNEEEIIEGEVKGILTSLAKELPALDYEILLVENGSKDRTKQIAEKLSSEVPRIKIISLPLPSYGGALKTGILRSQGDVVVIFNIDFWDIVFIKKALNIHEKWDLVVGSKNALGAEDLRLVTRRLLTKFFNVFLRVFFGFRGTDTHGMKVMRRDKVSSIAERCRPNKMLFDTELVLRAQHKGLIIKEIPVVCEEKRPSTLIPSSPIKIIKTGFKVLKDLTIIFFSLYLGTARQRMAWGALFFSIAFVFFFSWPTLTTKPAVWYDEGINIELARNFAEFGKLDLITEPLQFTGQGSLIGSTGYPVTIPLAIFFKIFGFGFAQARAYMLLWMTAALISIFWFVKKICGEAEAAMALLLVVSFASFYGNGRSVMGEIPGLIFMILSLGWFISKKSLMVSGIFLGLAVVSKPSVFISLIPAWIIFLAWNKKDFLVKVTKLGIGSFLPFLVWIFIYFNQVFSLDIWEKLQDHLSNPYKEAGISSWSNIKNNLVGFFYTPTLVYFLFFMILIVLAVFFDRDFYRRNRFLFMVSGWYSLSAFLFFLKSLGYLRYLIAVELLILMLLPASLIKIAEYIKKPKLPVVWVPITLLVLVVFQFGYLFTRAKLFYSDSPEKTIKYIENNFPNHSIGVINIPPVAALVPPEKRYQTISSYGLMGVGLNPLSLEKDKLPGIIVLEDVATLEDDYKIILSKFYKQVNIPGNKDVVYYKL